MINFIKHKLIYNAKVGWCFPIKKGTTILKILFNKRDIHESRNGKLHLDIWGYKLVKLKKLLEDK